MIAMIVLALLPIVLLIGLGYVLKRRQIIGEGFWPQAEKLTYFILLPSLFLHALAAADLQGVPLGSLVPALIVPPVVVAAGLFLANRYLHIEGPAFTSVFQGGIRFNNYIGITAAVGLFGGPAVALAAVANATIVPTVNVLCVLAFARFGGLRASPLQILRSIALNPLVASCAAGIALQAAGIGLPPGVDGFFKALGAAALPMGLLCVGAALDWDALGRRPHLSVVASTAKFLVLPLCTLIACYAFGLSGKPAMVAMLFHSLPTASSSYVMARQLGGDAPLMAGIVASQTVLAALTVPATLLLAQVLF